MECNDAIELIREHITELRFNPDMYVNGEPKLDLVFALEDFVIPAMEKEIARDVVVEISVAEYGRRYYACPNCKDFLKWAFGSGEPDRCPYCGQTLNWRR